MKNTRIFIFVISLLMAVNMLFTSCGEKPKTEIVPEPQKVVKTFEKTGINLIENDTTSYKIVIKEGNDSVSLFAANELIEFLRLATGVTLPIISDSELTYDSTSRYISLGETSLLKTAGITVTKEELGESGYKLKTIGNTLFIASVTSSNFNGTIYGVYDMLKYTIGLKIYAADEVVYNQTKIVPLYKFDEQYRPSIDMRVLEWKPVKDDKTYAYRMKSTNNLGLWASFTHTLISDFLPYNKYGTLHPDWYVGNGRDMQLCLTNEEMIEEMCVQIEAKLDSNPTTTLVMLGHEDNNTFCYCNKCTQVLEKYGGVESGVELEFSNKVAEKVDKWLASNYPDRVVKYVFFAYGPTLNAPVTYDAATDTYTKNLSDMYINEHVGVMVAPIAMNFSKLTTDSENSSSYIALKSWSHLFDNEDLYIWHYSLASSSYFYNYNNFGVIQDYYQLYRDIGTSYIFDQGYYDSNVCAFEQLRIYTQSQLMWNCDETSYEELASEFINQYYGAASEKITEYYNLIRAHYGKLEKDGKVNGTIFFLYDDVNLWPIGIVNKMLQIMDDAILALEPLKQTDPARYETLYSRIQKERLSPLYIILKYYIDQISDDAKTSYIEDFENYAKKYSIQYSREGSFDVAGIIESWKKS